MGHTICDYRIYERDRTIFMSDTKFKEKCEELGKLGFEIVSSLDIHGNRNVIEYIFMRKRKYWF